MRLLRSLEARKNRAVWRDSERKHLTLESFARTEEDGGKDLLVAARRTSDPELAKHLERHAADEVKHAELFRRRAAEVRAEIAGGAHAELPDKPYDLTRGRGGQVDAHGFFSAGLIDELGEVDYVAMLHVAEMRAAQVFEMHRELARDDERMRAIFDEILKDEKYHCAYTRKFLDQWRSDGREREVKQALKNARGSRFMGAWKRLGLRSAAGLSKLLLYALYWTVLAPFGLGSRRARTSSGWRDSAQPGDSAFRQA